MRVLVLDKDTDYSERLKYYLSKKYSQLLVSICDNLDSAKQSMANEAFDVILFDASFDEVNVEQLASFMGKAAFAFISETNEVVKDTETIMKYIMVSEMFGKLCELYETKRDRVVKQTLDQDPAKHETQIVSFFPVHGGAGSSTLAAAFAISLAREHEVLYINMEQRPSDAAFFNGESKKGVSEIVSVLKTKYTDASLIQAINSSIQKDSLRPNIRLSYIKGFSNIMDCLSMTAQGVETLLRVIKEKLNYRYVIIDADFIIWPVLNSIIATSDKMVFVTSGADVANSKLSKIQRYLDILKRNEDIQVPNSYLLFNQYYGMKDELSVARDMTIIARIARYRTDDKTRITSKKVIDEILAKKDVFNALITVQEAVTM